MVGTSACPVWVPWEGSLEALACFPAMSPVPVLCADCSEPFHCNHSWPRGGQDAEPWESSERIIKTGGVWRIPRHRQFAIFIRFVCFLFCFGFASWLLTLRKHSLPDMKNKGQTTDADAREEWEASGGRSAVRALMLSPSRACRQVSGGPAQTEERNKDLRGSSQKGRWSWQSDFSQLPPVKTKPNKTPNALQKNIRESRVSTMHQ